jgi:hypothetical protein
LHVSCTQEEPSEASRPETNDKEPTDMAIQRDRHDQIRALYRSLLECQSNFHEFKALLTLYPASLPPNGQETAEASLVRARLNSRISEWLGDEFDAMTVEQLLQWRAIVVDERFNNVLPTWRESNIW